MHVYLYFHILTYICTGMWMIILVYTSGVKGGKGSMKRGYLGGGAKPPCNNEYIHVTAMLSDERQEIRNILWARNTNTVNLLNSRINRLTEFTCTQRYTFNSLNYIHVDF